MQNGLHLFLKSDGFPDCSSTWYTTARKYCCLGCQLQEAASMLRECILWHGINCGLCPFLCLLQHTLGAQLTSTFAVWMFDPIWGHRLLSSHRASFSPWLGPDHVSNQYRQGCLCVLLLIRPFRNICPPAGSTEKTSLPFSSSTSWSINTVSSCSVPVCALLLLVADKEHIFVLPVKL